MGTKHDEDESLGLLNRFGDDARWTGYRVERTELNPDEREALLQGLRQKLDEQRAAEPVDQRREAEPVEDYVPDEHTREAAKELDQAMANIARALNTFHQLGVSQEFALKLVESRAQLRWQVNIDKDGIPTLSQMLDDPTQHKIRGSSSLARASQTQASKFKLKIARLGKLPEAEATRARAQSGVGTRRPPIDGGCWFGRAPRRCGVHRAVPATGGERSIDVVQPC